MGKSIMMHLIFSDIEQGVARAIAAGGILSTSAVASRVKASYPRSRFSERDIEDVVIDLASKAGVAVEFGRRAGEAHASGSEPPP